MNKPLLLVVEPDGVLAGSLRAALSGSGYDVVHAYTAQEAVIKADQSIPALVILELQLVGHSGMEFLYEFRSYSDWERVPVIIYSSVPPGEFAGSRETLLEQLGVRAFLYKPNTPLTELVQTVNNLRQMVSRSNESI